SSALPGDVAPTDVSPEVTCCSEFSFPDDRALEFLRVGSDLPLLRTRLPPECHIPRLSQRFNDGTASFPPGLCGGLAAGRVHAVSQRSPPAADVRDHFAP